MRKFNVEIKWGIILALGMFAVEFVVMLLGYHDEKIEYHPYVSMTGFLVIIIAIWLGMLEKRSKVLGGRMSYTQALVVGVLIGAFAVPLSLILTYVMVEFISPDYFTNAIAMSVEKGFSQEIAEANFNTRMYMVQSVLGVLGMSVLFTLLLALITRKTA